MRENDIITGVDLGSSAIRVVIGRVNSHGVLDILGFQESPFQNIRHGVITDLYRTVDMVKKLLVDAGDEAGIEIESVVVNIGGDYVRSFSYQSVVPIKHGDQKIRNIDLYRAVYETMDEPIPESFEIIHTEVNDFVVDGVGGIQKPLKMVANELKADLHVFVGKRNFLQNIVNIFGEMRISIEGFFANAFVIGEAVLAQEEKELGVICLDVGALSTDVLVYQQGKVMHGFSMALGYDSVTEHLAQSLRISREQAQDIKEKYAYVGPMQVGEDRDISLQNVARATFSRVSPEQLSRLVEQELQRLFSRIDLRLQEDAAKEMAYAGVVLTGGLAHLKGAVHMLEKVLQKPVRIGNVQCPIKHNGEYLQGYQYALCVGLVRTAYQHFNPMIRRPGRVERFRHLVGTFFFDLF